MARYANVALEKGSPIATEEDVFGGQGYVADSECHLLGRIRRLQSRRQARGADGGALHPGRQGQDRERRAAKLRPGLRRDDPLGMPATPLSAPSVSASSAVDKSSWITGDEKNPGNVGTDIAVIESLRKGIDVQPAATVWTAATAVTCGRPRRPTAVKIIGLVAPFEGQQVCRSGRTTGWSCGTVQELGIYVVGGTTADPADLRAFRGFLSKDVQSSGGDSGGPWISGNFAVGTHSAGDGAGATENFAIATTLEDSLARIPGGVQLQLFLNKPELVAPADQTVTARATGHRVAYRPPRPLPWRPIRKSA